MYKFESNKYVEKSLNDMIENKKEESDRMKLEEIFSRIENENYMVKSERKNLFKEQETLFDKEEELLIKEIELMKGKEYAKLKNDKSRKAYLNENTQNERFQVNHQKINIKQIECNIQFRENQIKMYNRMIDNKFYESE